jgi:SSS family solute:Na+ symporter
MIKWAKIMGISGVVMILAAAIVVIGGKSNSVFAYLNDIGFQCFFFFGVLVGQCAIWLWSNSHDKIMDRKALPVDLKLFHTDKAYNWGAFGICLIVTLLYVLLW